MSDARRVDLETADSETRPSDWPGARSTRTSIGSAAALRGAAIALVDPQGRQDEVLPELCDAVEPGRPRIRLELAQSSIGPVPRLGRPAWSAGELSLATLALLAATCRGADREERLAMALTLEGLIGYYRHSDPSFRPAQQGLAYALRYASIHLEEAGRQVPAGLGRAVASHRSITPMAGGA